MKDFTQLRKNLKKDFGNLKSIKIAVLGDNSTQLLVQALKGLGYDYKYNLDIWEADFNQIERQVYDMESDLYKFEPEITLFFFSAHKLLNQYNKRGTNNRKNFAEETFDSISNLHTTVSANLNTKILLYNLTEIDDSVFGSYANKIESSFLFQLRKLNYLLMTESTRNANFYLVDISSVQNRIGKQVLFQSSIYINTEMVLSIEALPSIASRTLDVIVSFYGTFKKCLILDLDNTIWGGIIGDDGPENIQIGTLGIGKAFSEFQQWVKKLKERGIIIAVCSKNTESVAKEPFEKHPDMVLRLEDISVFVANWGNKADNIRWIQKVLNIGFDSMVFLDDNPFERTLVCENIPEICIPELPEDPAEYLEYLYSLNLFETSSFSDEDRDRTKLYQVEAERAAVQQKFTNEGDYLKSLNMVSVIEKFTPFNIPRVAQLSQRSNQFNLRTIRYSEAEIEQIANNDNYIPFAFTLKDKFGDNGLICVVILEKKDNQSAFIDTWFMSCRVLKRGMEQFVLNTIVDVVGKEGITYLIGEYIPTAKNEMVKFHYEDLEFEKQGGQTWLLNISTYKEKKTYIKTKE
jgi:HAD-superfamily phosphatase, subfamily IIIC/FkbH-like domain